jgi:hypothetical protein
MIIHPLQNLCYHQLEHFIRNKMYCLMKTMHIAMMNMSERLSFAIGTDIESAVGNDESIDEDSADDATLDAKTRVAYLPSAPNF